MICSLLNRELGLVCRRVLRFLDASLSSAMGCFFVCLRIKEDEPDRSRRRSNLVVSDKKPDVAASRNPLSSLFAAEERENTSGDDKGSWVSGSPRISKEIKDEAKFLKACGTIPETPVEIRKAGEKLRRSPPDEPYSGTPIFHSWLPSTSIKKLQTDMQPARPYTPVKHSEERWIASESLDQTPISCISNADGPGFGSSIMASKAFDDGNVNSGTPFTPWPTGTNTQGGSKSVRFDRNADVYPLDESLPGNANSSLKKINELTGKDSAIKPSPHPTPLKLSDDMQTPGTVFPANIEHIQQGKTNVRSQYVCAVPNPIPDVSQRKDPKEGNSQHDQLSGESREKPTQSASATFLTNLAIVLTDEEELNFEASLSTWLKPPIDNAKKFQPALNKQTRFGRTHGDRPIIGLVATHWNEDEQSHITPKWWDGKGIPNSTSKYKEDQKVSWHATPFEERLEKALSEESSFSTGNQVTGLEKEDGDSAISQLHSSPLEKSLISC